MPGDLTGGGQPLGPQLEGIAALVLAVTGGIATIVGVMRSGRKSADPPTTSAPPHTDDLQQRLAIGLLDMNERALQASTEAEDRAVRRVHALETLLHAHGIAIPAWED